MRVNRYLGHFNVLMTITQYVIVNLLRFKSVKLYLENLNCVKLF